MDKLELYELIAGGEDSFVEFKRDVSQRSDFAGEMIAFANSYGGRILVGVDDDGAVVGVPDLKRTEEAILNMAHDNVNPALRVTLDRVEDAGKIVLVVQIPMRSGHPYENNSGQCYIRAGSTKRLATPQERARLLQAAGLVHFDETPVHGTSIEDFDLATFEAFLQKTLGAGVEATGLPLQQLLLNRRLMVPDLNQVSRLSVAGLLVFGKTPQTHMPQARISAVRWAGDVTGETIYDRQELGGRLPDLIDQAEAFLRRNLQQGAMIQDFTPTERPQYPIEALREAVVNAVAHRDYSLETAQIRLFVFDSRVEIHSPGRLPNSVTLDNMKTGFSAPRNRLIAQLLSNLNYLSSFGTGVPRMIRLMKERTGIEPEFTASESVFTVKLFAATT